MLRLLTMACLVALAGCGQETAYDPDRQANDAAADIGDQLGGENLEEAVNGTGEDIGDTLEATNNSM